MKDVVLRSGGAVYADHVAVMLYLRHQDMGGLELYMR